MATHSIVYEEAGKQPVTFRFSMLTLAQEDEYAEWAREQYMTEAQRSCAMMPLILQAKFLAEVSTQASLAACAFESEMGLSRLKGQDAQVKVLEMASRENHSAPGIPADVLKKLLREKEQECGRVIMEVIPISEEARKILLDQLDKRQKKTQQRNGRMAGRSSQQLKFAENSETSHSASAQT